MTGVGLLAPWPGVDVLEAQTTVLGELAETPTGVQGVPPLVELPARGPAAGPVGRAGALLPEMPVELGPHGWRLADRPGADLQRCRSVLREDLDALAVAAYGYRGPLAVPVLGPWTLAAELYLARGDRVLSDRGAVRELVASLTEGIGELLGAVATAAPGAEPVVVLREGRLPAVLAGAVPTFSGHGRLWSVAVEDASTALRAVVAGVRAAGAAVVVGAGARPAEPTWRALEGAGADAVALPVVGLDAQAWERVGTAVEAGRGLWLGLPATAGDGRVGVAATVGGGRADVAATVGGGRTDVAAAVRAVAGPWRAVGLPVAGLADVTVVVGDLAAGAGTDGGAGAGAGASSGAGEGPGPGARGDAGPGEARQRLRDAVRVAGALAELADAG